MRRRKVWGTPGEGEMHSAFECLEGDFSHLYFQVAQKLTRGMWQGWNIAKEIENGIFRDDIGCEVARVVNICYEVLSDCR